MEISCKVLIAEDEYITRQGIRNMIDWNAEGFEIVGEACNGQDALDLAEKLKPHIVLTDIVMPIMDGLTFEKEIRARHPEIQIVVLSSYSDFDYVRDSFQSGVVDYILKPTLNPADLLKTMKQVAARIPGLTLKGRQDVSVASYVEQLLSGEAHRPIDSFRNGVFLYAGLRNDHGGNCNCDASYGHSFLPDAETVCGWHDRFREIKHTDGPPRAIKFLKPIQI